MHFYTFIADIRIKMYFNLNKPINVLGERDPLFQAELFKQGMLLAGHFRSRLSAEYMSRF